MAGRLVGLGPFDPVANVTPFTYRDGDTYLSILEKLRDNLDTHTGAINANVDAVNAAGELATNAAQSALDAANSANGAALSAQQAASLVDAPADDVMAQILGNAESQASIAVAGSAAMLDRVRKSELDVSVATALDNPDSASSISLGTHPAVTDKVTRGELILSIADYAAVGDGVADDTTPLQNAINAASAQGGGKVLLPKVHKITSTILLPANVTLSGHSFGSSKIVVVGDIPAIKSPNPAARLDGWGLVDLYIDRDHANPTTPIIDLTGMSYGIMENVSIRQTTSRGVAIGVKFGAFSYYNTIFGCQVRGTDTGYLLTNEANRNRFTGNNSAITCNNGFVVDQSNSNTFVGASAEHIDGIGFLFRNLAKLNTVVGCAVEDAPTCYKADATSITNYFIGLLGFERAGGVRFDLSPTANVLIDPAAAGQLAPYTLRTFVDAYKSVAQAAIPAGTFTKITFETEVNDHINEFAGSTFTAATDGLYEVRSRVLFNAGVADTHLELACYVNGVIRRTLDDQYSKNAQATSVGGSAPIKLAKGDTVEIFAKSSAALGLTSGWHNTNFNIVRIA